MKKFLTIGLALFLALALAVPALSQSPVEPPEVNIVLPPGSEATVVKTVTTPTIPPNPDIYFLADTTGSMGPVHDAVQANASAILTTIVAEQPTAQFGVGNYKDFPHDAYCFQHQLSITSDTTAVVTAVGAWEASGGSDFPEGQFYALDRLAANDDPANGDIGWRDGPNKIVVWFGDAPAHDPVPMVATGLGYDIDEASVIADLVSAGIKVVAISWDSGEASSPYRDGLDDDPTIGGGDYAAAYGITEDGSPGQATAIAAATGGVYLFAATPEEAAAAVLAGIEALTTDVWWEVTECDEGLNVELSPDVLYDVVGGSTVDFTETIWLDEEVEEGTVLCATVTFYANSYPVIEGAEIGIQTICVSKGYLDIKPGSYPNSINTKARGVIPVALLGYDGFDVRDVDVATLTFGPNDATPVHNLNDPETYEDHIQDVNFDGYEDLIIHFNTRDTGLTTLDTSAELDYNGSTVSDSVRVIK